jgi:hypothetical protein
VLFVSRVGKYLEKFLVRKYSAHILRRRIALAAYAERADIIAIALRNFLKLQRMPPLIAEIINIQDSTAGSEIQVAQANGPVVDGLKQSIRIGNAVDAASDLEFMQVIVLPVHNGLNDAMDLRGSLPSRDSRN